MFSSRDPLGQGLGRARGGSGRVSGVPEGGAFRVVQGKACFSRPFTTHLKIGFAVLPPDPAPPTIKKWGSGVRRSVGGKGSRKADGGTEKEK
jgi:hypothetical protein